MLTPSSLRILAQASVSRTAARGLSTQTSQAVERLKSVLEGYRQTHYTQEIPTRFKKEIVQAAAGGNDQGIGLAGVERLLANITTDGNTAAGVTVSKQDLQLIFTEVGTGGQIPTQRFFQMI